MKINLAVMFGGRSVEHEISVISAVQAMLSLDRAKYDVIPVYLTKSGGMMTGSALFDIGEYKDMPSLMQKLKRIIIVRESDGVLIYEKKGAKTAKKPLARIDAVLPVVHGTNCEDGTLQGWLELLGVPYAGCGVTASAIGMDKEICKNVLAAHGVSVLPHVTFYAKDWVDGSEKISSEIAEKLGFPVIVKPANLGSSVGISKASDADALAEAVTLAMNFASKLIVEPAIEHLREINCAVLGNADSCRASVCEEPVMSDEILSYSDKYLSSGKSKGAGGSKGMASLSRKIPADIPEEKSKEIADMAVAAFRAVGACGVTRIDFLMDTADGDRVYLNEINTIPGSLSFYLWEKSGLTYTELLDELVELAFAHARANANLSFTFDTNILSGNIKLGGGKGKL